MRMGWRKGLAAAVLCVTTMVTCGEAQEASTDAPQAQGQPAAPAKLEPMPAPDPANFTTSTPTRETVNEFLKQNWGHDPNRIWQVQGIQATRVPGVSRVTVLVEEKGGQQSRPSALSFLTLPDGKNLITADEQGMQVMPFGARPFAEFRQALQQDAKGPFRGPANAQLLLVEFADFQCPHCKEALPTVERLLQDFPDARFVAEQFPLRTIHSEAEKASEEGVCVAKVGGNEAYFKFSDAIYANQASLTPQGSTQALLAAVTAAGVDPEKVKSCVAQPSTKAAVDASLKLGESIGVNATPTLYVNGRALPSFPSIPYGTLKQIIHYQMQIDGGAAK